MPSKDYKWCRGCQSYVALAEFHNRGGAHLDSRCRNCRMIEQRNKPSYEAARGVRVPPHIYQELLAVQKGRCAICRRPPSPKRKLAVDHDHDTGQIRGLLCMDCNTGMGKLQDSQMMLERAIRYLECVTYEQRITLLEELVSELAI